MRMCDITRHFSIEKYHCSSNTGRMFTTAVSLIVDESSPMQERLKVVRATMGEDVIPSAPAVLIQLLATLPTTVHVSWRGLSPVTVQVETLETFQKTLVKAPLGTSEGLTRSSPFGPNDGPTVRHEEEPAEQK